MKWDFLSLSQNIDHDKAFFLHFYSSIICEL